MLRTFAAGLLATALIAGPAFAQTSNSSATPNAAPSATVQAKTPAAASANTTTATQAANPRKTVKHTRLHKRTVRHVASRSHVKSDKIHQARHLKPVKSHQAKTQVKTSATAKRS